MARSTSDSAGGTDLADLRPASEKRFEVAECPIFDDRRQLAFFIDIWGRSLTSYDPATEATASVELPDLVGFVALCRDDRLVVGLRDRIVALDWESGRLEVLRLLDLDENERVNDGCAAPNGSLFFGTMRIAADRPSGRIVRMDRDGHLMTLPGALTIPNGPAFDKWGDMVHTDSATGEIRRTKRGRSRSAPWLTIPPELGKPDGLCHDTDGRLWCALWGGGAIAVFERDVGEINPKPVPATYVTALGPLGAEGGECLVTTASRPFRQSNAEIGRFDGMVLRARLLGARILPSRRAHV